MDFDTWLSERLLELKTDEDVFGPYIKGIVEGDEELEDQVEALDGILQEFGVPSLNVESLRNEILSRWKTQKETDKKNVLLAKNIGSGGGDCAGSFSLFPPASTDKNDKTGLSSAAAASNGFVPDSQNNSSLSSDFNSQFDKLLRLQPDNPKPPSKDLGPSTDSALRDAILKQYLQDSDSDEDGEHPRSSELSGLSKNTNAERVLNDHKEQREIQKVESAKKREKDREDRAKQKKLAEERKEKAKKKTAKVERKR